MTSNNTDKTPLLSSEIPENPIVLPSSTQQLSSSQLLAKPSSSSSSSTTASTSSITPTPSLVSLKQPTLSPSSNTAKTNSKLVKSNKIGLQRTSRTSQKLKLLPEDPDLDIINTLSGKKVIMTTTTTTTMKMHHQQEYILKSRKSLIHQHVKMQKH